MGTDVKKIIVTGGAGFIGSALVRFLINETQHRVLNLDALTYAGNLASLAGVSASDRYRFIHVDLRDKGLVERAVTEFQPDYVMHLAAESHVDRSIDGPEGFVDTNVKGTFNLLEASRAYWEALSGDKQCNFRLHHISTDEVYGSLGTKGLFTEESHYQPNSPYAATKAAADHLVRAWHKTYGLPVVSTNCCNNYGPFHHPEKLIPLMILSALEQRALPVYGDGSQIRDWLYVEDHVRALYKAVTVGNVGETYNIGANSEYKNIDIVNLVCQLLNEIAPQYLKLKSNYTELITFVDDRPGHDQRYGIDASKAKRELGWAPRESFESGLKKTVHWYLANREWCDTVEKKSKRERLGCIGKKKAVV